MFLCVCVTDGVFCLRDDQCTVQTMFIESSVKGVAWDFSHKRSAGAYFKC